MHQSTEVKMQSYLVPSQQTPEWQEHDYELAT